MVSLVWGCFQMGSLIAACLVGPVADKYNPQARSLLLALLLALLLFTFLLADKYNPQVLFWVCLPLAASIIYPTSRGWLQDDRVSPELRYSVYLLNYWYKITCLLVQKYPTCRGWL
jgi:MFS family permease